MFQSSIFKIFLPLIIQLYIDKVLIGVGADPLPGSFAVSQGIGERRGEGWPEVALNVFPL